jgi:hypothetical protein
MASAPQKPHLTAPPYTGRTGGLAPAHLPTTGPGFVPVTQWNQPTGPKSPPADLPVDMMKKG